MLTKDNNISDYFMHYNEEKYSLSNKKSDLKEGPKRLDKQKFK